MSRPIAVEEEGSDEAFDAFITYLNTPSKSNTKAKDNHASYNNNNIMFPSASVAVTDTSSTSKCSSDESITCPPTSTSGKCPFRHG